MTAETGQPVDGNLVVPVVGGLGADPVRNHAVVRLDGRLAGQLIDVAGLGQGAGRPNDHLGRDAAVIRAFATDQVRLDAQHRATGLGQPLGHLAATWPEAEHDHVVVVGKFCWMLRVRGHAATVSRIRHGTMGGCIC